ncbi:MAG TPA: hypothetical protein VFX16_13895 [Pseudonocardiaceae bacterium]|nr:hypothetical protein [Pseudonocardiaceae bacterium]
MYRIAIMDRGQIIALDTPSALTASVGKDTVRVDTMDNAQAVVELRDRFGIEATIKEGSVLLAVPGGERFVLFAELDVLILSVSVARPSLTDVFMSYTGTAIREAEATGSERLASSPMARMRRR